MNAGDSQRETRENGNCDENNKFHVQSPQVVLISVSLTRTIFFATIKFASDDLGDKALAKALRPVPVSYT